MNSSSKRDREQAATLEILTEISVRNDVTQRALADQLGVALGIANSYLKRCVKKGFVKIQQAPANRYLYYLTPKGFAEKSRLTSEYLAFSFNFYKQASADMRDCLLQCHADGVRGIIFVGVSELAEIGSVRMHEIGLSLVATYEPNTALEEFLGRPVWNKWNCDHQVDACVLTMLEWRPEMYAEALERVGAHRTYVPSLIKPLNVELDLA